MEQQVEAVSLKDDRLPSQRQMTFGYPPNGLNYVEVTDLNGA